MAPKKSSFRTIAVLLPLALILTLAGCSKTGEFMGYLRSLFGGKAEVQQIAESPPPVGPNVLNKAQMVAQLSGVAVSPGMPAPPAHAGAQSANLLCDLEHAITDDVSAKGDRLEVAYSAEGAACPATWFRGREGKLGNTKAAGTFSFVVDCKGGAAAAAKVAGRSTDFLARASFDFAGAAERACLDAQHGESAFTLSRTSHAQFDVVDSAHAGETATYIVDDFQSATGPGGGPCRVKRSGDDGVVSSCVYRSESKNETRVASKPEGNGEISSVNVTATAKDLVARPGQRYFAGGTIEIAINQWHGTIEFKSGGSSPPIVELTDGHDVVKVKLAGSFTEEMR